MVSVHIASKVRIDFQTGQELQSSGSIAFLKLYIPHHLISNIRRLVGNSYVTTSLM